MENIIVDARGHQCPVPVVMTIKALEGVKGPCTVETHVDNETAVQNVTRLAGSRGFPVTSEKLAADHFVIYMQAPQPASGPSGEPRAEEIVCAPDRRGSTVVAVTTDSMGHGNEELGKTLMKGFLYALSQLEELPKTILFYNGGAKLTTEGSLSLEDLRSMEAQGVKILTCGTCLNFYGLTEKLAVGEVTNMYSIVETLAGADKIIKP
ncbi:MAG: sulfurtransferase-like selenium metabolism protein YedF [Oscillospiraceae bacterium]|nr:sulfurtransferase-like selenium metabolism protein YedF [Oscillospiraceae bacterium]